MRVAGGGDQQKRAYVIADNQLTDASDCDDGERSQAMPPGDNPDRSPQGKALAAIYAEYLGRFS